MVPADLRGWIVQTLVPHWIERAVEPGRPGYLEYVTADGGPDRRDVKTTLVTARLIYVVSHAHLLAPSNACLDAARHGMEFLLAHCRGQDGTFRHSVRSDGSPVDGRTDLYDLAFVLFGIAWYVRATGDTARLAVAEQVLDFMDRRLASPAGGFVEDSIGTVPRRQNPHMHLVEAFHALAETTRDERWLDRAKSIVELLQGRLLDRQTGSLGEFFTTDWSPWPGEQGLLREPGHHLEWVWLLLHHARLSGDRTVLETADRLYRFARRAGIALLPDGSPVVLDGVRPDGSPVAGTGLLWPQTEAVKAYAARLEFGDDQAEEPLRAHLGTMFSHYVSLTGDWYNQLSATGEPVPGELPVRVLYHLVLALAEADRVLRERSVIVERGRFPVS
jgi:mannose/cellobiose epimerase-like protein (N-acyl-D-glucosamine 2-epimerase family)